jgi:hypothetical protein
LTVKSRLQVLQPGHENNVYDEWIISDFGLNDAIEAGLVKTPRVVIRDDAPANAKTYASKLPPISRGRGSRGSQPQGRGA